MVFFFLVHLTAYSQVHTDDMTAYFYDEIQELIFSKPETCHQILIKVEERWHPKSRKHKILHKINFIEDSLFEHHNTYLDKAYLFRIEGDSIVYLENSRDKIEREIIESKRLFIAKDSGIYRVEIFQWDTSKVDYSYFRRHYDSLNKMTKTYYKNVKYKRIEESLMTEKKLDSSVLRCHFNIVNSDTSLCRITKRSMLESESGDIIKEVLYDSSINNGKEVSQTKTTYQYEIIRSKEDHNRIIGFRYWENDFLLGEAHIKYQLKRN